MNCSGDIEVGDLDHWQEAGGVGLGKEVGPPPSRTGSASGVYRKVGLKSQKTALVLSRDEGSNEGWFSGKSATLPGPVLVLPLPVKYMSRKLMESSLVE